MSDSLTQALADPGPHTAESLAARLPGFPVEAIQQALDALTAQGVLAGETGPDGRAAYRYVAPDRYAQINLDVVVNPAAAQDPHARRRR